ncbi:MAG: sugar ABC transporter substrate-binding protein [Actinobacteria bacterium]|nr:sugar ABC transporter substrate-binding protein [Actinomycetota bacterium]
MKKLLLWLTVMLVSISMVVAFSLTGCKAPVEEEVVEEEAPPAEEEVAEEAPGEEEAAVPEEVELSWIQWWEGEVGVELLDSLETKFIEEHPGVTIKRENLPYQQMYDKLITLAQAGELPDVMGMQADWISSFEPLGALESLDSRMDEEGLKDQFAFLATWKGKEWLIYIYGGAVVVFCNTQMFENAGVTYPETWDEYIEVSRKLTDPAKGQYATAAEMAVEPPSGIYYWIYPLLLQAGGRLADDELNLVYNDEAGVAALEFLGTLYNEGLLLPGTLANTEKEKRDAFAAETIAMYNDGPWGIGVQKSMGVEFPYDIILMPKGSATRGTWAAGSGLAISSTSKNKDVAWEFIKFLTTGEGNKMWVETTRNLSVYKPNLAMSYIQDDPKLKVIASQLEEPGTMTTPIMPGAVALQKAIMVEVQKYLNGEKSAQQALDDSIVAYQEAMEKGE